MCTLLPQSNNKPASAAGKTLSNQQLPLLLLLLLLWLPVIQ
jgi:hypothetical protein